ncbi:hypothetical protein ACJX0J_031825, partial [Zea mays]
VSLIFILLKQFSITHTSNKLTKRIHEFEQHAMSFDYLFDLQMVFFFLNFMNEHKFLNLQYATNVSFAIWELTQILHRGGYNPIGNVFLHTDTIYIRSRALKYHINQEIFRLRVGSTLNNKKREI